MNDSFDLYRVSIKWFDTGEIQYIRPAGHRIGDRADPFVGMAGTKETDKWYEAGKYNKEDADFIVGYSRDLCSDYEVVVENVNRWGFTPDEEEKTRIQQAEEDDLLEKLRKEKAWKNLLWA